MIQHKFRFSWLPYYCLFWNFQIKANIFLCQLLEDSHIFFLWRHWSKKLPGAAAKVRFSEGSSGRSQRSLLTKIAEPWKEWKASTGDFVHVLLHASYLKNRYRYWLVLMYLRLHMCWFWNLLVLYFYLGYLPFFLDKFYLHKDSLRITSVTTAWGPLVSTHDINLMTITECDVSVKPNWKILTWNDKEP